MKQGVTQIVPHYMRVPCDIWGCRSGQSASHFIGRPENPKNVVTNICPTCLEQLKESIFEQFPVPEVKVIKEGALNPEEMKAALELTEVEISELSVKIPETLQPVEPDYRITAGTITSDQLIEGQLNSAKINEVSIPKAIIQESPGFDDVVDVLEIDGKLITEFSVRELKELCQEEKIAGYSNKDKEELIALVTAHFEKSEE